MKHPTHYLRELYTHRVLMNGFVASNPAGMRVAVDRDVFLFSMEDEILNSYGYYSSRLNRLKIFELTDSNGHIIEHVLINIWRYADTLTWEITFRIADNLDVLDQIDTVRYGKFER